MKSLKNGLLAMVMMAAMSTGANAALLIEPHIGYNVSGSGDTAIDDANMEVDYSGLQYGLRAGWQYLGFMVGLDYTTSNPEIESTFTVPAVPGFSQTVKNDFKKKEIGVFAGYNLPILLRAWAGYYFDVEAKSENESDLIESGAKMSGSGMELGVGFTGLPFVSLNLVYRNTSFDEFKDSEGTDKIKLNASEIVLGASIPFTL